MVNKLSKKKVRLDGKTWLQYSISIWSDIRKNKGEVALRHPAMFPSMLPKRLIECFSSENDIVFDSFAGIGSTLLAAKELKRYTDFIENKKKIGFKHSSQEIKFICR